MGPLKHWVLFPLVDIRTTAKLFSLSEAIEKDEGAWRRMKERGEQRDKETLRQQRADSNHSADKNVTHSRKQLQLQTCHKTG